MRGHESNDAVVELRDERDRMLKVRNRREPRRDRVRIRWIPKLSEQTAYSRSVCRQRRPQTKAQPASRSSNSALMRCSSAPVEVQLTDPVLVPSRAGFHGNRTYVTLTPS